MNVKIDQIKSTMMVPLFFLLSLHHCCFCLFKIESRLYLFCYFFCCCYLLSCWWGNL